MYNILNLWNSKHIHRVKNGVFDNISLCVCVKTYALAQVPLLTSERKHEKYKFCNRDDDFPVSPIFNRLLPKLHISQKKEEEESTKYVKEQRGCSKDILHDKIVNKKVLLWDDGYNNHRDTCGKIK